MKIKKPGLLIISILVTQLAGIIGSIATTQAIPTWYATLNKPFFNPPNLLFGPVWLTLYTLMGISLYLIWRQKQNKQTTFAKNLFIIHLVINTLWSLVFFGLKNLGLAYLIIIFLWLMIVTLIKLFYPLNKKASFLLVPYLLWVTFASLLNYAIWRLN
ncbi:MAG: tryptophan-rich sensory protein [Candidatus Pacebacteria bacterium]|nr:tryptophan-rich sensory protein [Candidatus Paceibacterota bacterium]